MFTRILVPTDFSLTADAALDYARALAAKFGASLHLLHVLEDPVTSGPLTPTSSLEASTFQSTLLDDARLRLAHRALPGPLAQMRATTDAIAGTATRAIVEYAATHGIDLIVMGTHGRTGVAHLLIGSVAERVVRTAPCPVLTVRLAAAPVAEPAGIRFDLAVTPPV